MSAEEVLEQYDYFLSSLPLGEAALKGVSQAVKLTEIPIIQLMYQLGTYAGLGHDEACKRVLPFLFQRSAILLASELPKQHSLNERQVNSCLLTLQQLFNLSLSRIHLNEAQQIHCYKLLALVGATQQADVGAQQWNIERSMQAAKGLSGYQFEAYCSLISTHSSDAVNSANAETSKETHKPLTQLGHAFGILLHISKDIEYKRERFVTLQQSDQSKLKTWALNQAKLIADAEVVPLSLLLPSLIKYIR